MVVFYLRNSRAPSGKIVPITVSLNKEVLYPVIGSGFPNLRDQEGDGVWLLTVATSERDGSGDPIPTEFINIVSEATVHLELEAAIGRIGNKVSWGALAEDLLPPRVLEINPPLTQTTNVPIMSNILVRLQDPLPAAGMDLSTLNMTLNSFPVISGGVAQPGFEVQMRGNVFDFTIIHNPRKLLN